MLRSPIQGSSAQDFEILGWLGSRDADHLDEEDGQDWHDEQGAAVVRCLQSGATAMVRFLDLDAGKVDAEGRARAEVSLLSSSRCPQLLRYFCSFVEGSRLWVVTELAYGGTVLQAMTHRVEGEVEETFVQPLREAEVSAILREVVRGLCYLHNSGTLHRDLRCGNVYLSTETDGESSPDWSQVR